MFYNTRMLIFVHENKNLTFVFRLQNLLFNKKFKANVERKSR